MTIRPRHGVPMMVRSRTLPFSGLSRPRLSDLLWQHGQQTLTRRSNKRATAREPHAQLTRRDDRVRSALGATHGRGLATASSAGRVLPFIDGHRIQQQPTRGRARAWTASRRRAVVLTLSSSPGVAVRCAPNIANSLLAHALGGALSIPVFARDHGRDSASTQCWEVHPLQQTTVAAGRSQHRLHCRDEPCNGDTASASRQLVAIMPQN